MADTPDPADALRTRLEQLDAEIAERVEERERVERALEVLTACERPASISDMTKPKVAQAARLKLSKGQSKDALIEFASEAGLTLRDLAARVGCSGPLLTQARKGVRSISLELAKRVQAATRSAKHPEGFEATKANWTHLRVA